MKYIVLPAEILAEVTQEALDYFHLSPRYSIDGSEVIMKVDNYEKLFPSVMTLPETGEEYQGPFFTYPVYEGDFLDNLLKSKEWKNEELPI